MDKFLDKLYGTEEEFEFFLEGILKASVRLVNRTDELREELDGLEKETQIFISDEGSGFWFEHTGDGLIYQKGICKDAPLKVWLPKEALISILKQDVYASDLYMKGKIQLRGDIDQAIRLKNFLYNFTKYLRNIKSISSKKD